LIEDSPNVSQLKGLHLGDILSTAFPRASILILNDADAVAAGIAAAQGELGRSSESGRSEPASASGAIRVWTEFGRPATAS